MTDALDETSTELVAKYWPSTDGPSVFSAIPHFRTPEFNLFCRIDRDERDKGNEPLDWGSFRALVEVIGMKQIRMCFFGDEPSTVDAGRNQNG